MNKKEFLNEENYQRTKKKMIMISLVVLVLSLLIGGALIVTGVIKTHNSKEYADKINEERKNAAYKNIEVEKNKAKERIQEIDKEVKELDTKISDKEYKCNSLSMESQNWFADKSKCQKEVSELESQKSSLEMEKFKLENLQYNVYYDEVQVDNYILLYAFGGMIILFGSTVSLMIYMMAKRRDIAAFTIQQGMPLAEEVMDKMAPKVGNAVGEFQKNALDKASPAIGNLAKEVTKGIKSGLKDVDKK